MRRVFCMTAVLAAGLLSGSYRPAALPVVAFALDGTYVIPRCASGYYAASGSTDTIVTLPAASSCARGSVSVQDPYGLGDVAWVSVAPAAGETIDGLDADQRLLLVKPGSSLTLLSNGTTWACTDGSRGCVVDPRTVPDLVVWYDAQRGLTKDATSGRVTALADQSGNGLDLAEVASSGPIVSTGTNGLTMLTFDGSADYLRTASARQLTSATITLAAVYTDSASDTNARALFATDYAVAGTGAALLNDGVTAERTLLDGRWATSHVAFTAETLSRNTRTSPAQATQLRSVVGRVGAVSDGWIDGSSGGVIDSASAVATQPAMVDGYLYLGQSHAGNADGGWWAGSFQSLLLWDAGVSDANMLRVREFVRRRSF